MNRDRSTTPPSVEPCPATAPRALLDLATIEAQRPYIVRWLVWAAVPKEDVPDLTQDIVFALWRTRARYEPRTPTPAAWVRAFTKNIARGYMQSARVRREVPTDPATGPWADQAPEESCLDQAQTAEQLQRACSEVLERTPEDDVASAELLRRACNLLARLPPERAEVLLRHDGGDETMKDIAASLGIPVSTGFARLRIGRAELAQEIQREAAIAQHRRESEIWRSARSPTWSKGSKGRP